MIHQGKYNSSISSLNIKEIAFLAQESGLKSQSCFRSTSQIALPFEVTRPSSKQMALEGCL